MTEKLYYENVNRTEFDALVTDVKKGGNGTFLICLDRTAFYPEGGGQPCDTGILVSEDGKRISVTDVQETDGCIWHTTGQEIGIGEKLHGKIDWDRRFDHMQQHSGEHIVSGMICERFHCDNVGFHMGEEFITIDYNAVITYREALEIENKANRYIMENHPFKEMWPSGEELASICYRSKKELTGAVRITSFEGADTCACCGTHVPSSALVGMVKIVSAKKFHDGTRIELYCGKRAFDYLSLNFEENKAAAVLLSTKEDRTADAVKKLIEENISLKSASASLEEKYYTLKAASYAGGSNVYLFENDLDPEQGRRLADHIADRNSGLTVVFVRDDILADNKFRYSAIQRNSDISAFIKEMNKALCGRGGGRNGFAQGSVCASRKDIEEYLLSTGVF